MARQRFNVRQLSLTGSKSAMAAPATTLDDDTYFMMQTSGSDVELITAQSMQNYFSDIDVDAVNSGEYSLVFIDPAGADATTSGFDFKRDEDGNGAISWSPNSTAGNGSLKIVGDVKLDHDGAYIDWGDDQALRLAHVSGTTHKLILSGSSGAEFIQFGASGVEIGSSADGQLDIDAGTKIQLAGGAIDIDGTTVSVSGSGNHAFSGGGTAVHDYAGAVSIASDNGFSTTSTTVSISGSSSSEIKAGSYMTIQTADSANMTLTAGGSLNASASSNVDIDGTSVDIKANSGAAAMDASGALQLGISSATGVTVSRSGVTTAVQGALTVAQNATITGDLTVNGTTTTIDTSTLTVEDTLIVLGKDNDIGGGSLKDLGLLFERSGSGAHNSAFFWDESADYFRLKQGLVGQYADGLIGDSGSFAKLELGDFVAGGDVTLGSSSGDHTVSFASRITSSIEPSDDGAFDLGASGREWKKLWVNDIQSEDGNLDLTATSVNVAGAFDVTGATTLDGAVTIGDNSADDLVVNSADVDFANTPALLQTAVSGGADFLYVRDESASTMKKVTFSDLGKYLSRGISATGSDSQGIKVGDDGSLELQMQEDFFVSGGSNAGKTFALSAVSSAIATEVLDNSLSVYLNGQLQLASGSVTAFGDGDYSIGGANVIMRDAIDSDDVVIIRYLKK